MDEAYEQSLDRLGYQPSLPASYDWRVRHAGLTAIAAIGEGTGKVSGCKRLPCLSLTTVFQVMQNELDSYDCCSRGFDRVYCFSSKLRHFKTCE
jgi:hypothetical protein